MTKIIINELDDECRIAMTRSGKIEELSVELTSAEKIRGNLYKGTVTQVHQSLQAAFINFGDQRNGFLSIDELNFRMYPAFRQNQRPLIQDFLKEGTELIVQVVREASENKGAALTTFLSLPGRYMVLMPFSKGGGISKKVQDLEERERLKIFIESINTEEHSVIVRTAGVGKDLKELKKDYDQLLKTWNKIKRDAEKQKAPSLIFQEEDIIIRMFRDYFHGNVEEVWVDNPDIFQKVFQFLKTHEPTKTKILKIHNENRPIFSHFEIEKQVESLSNRKVNLGSGGYLVIDQTEALVAIDVNSGRSTKGSSNSDTAFDTNMEAAEEVARQLRLRNLGGLVVIDFIDMDNLSYNKKVRDKLVAAMSLDKAQHNISEFSRFSLIELSRQKISQGYAKSIETNCPYCEGTGKTRSLTSQVNAILRRLRDLACRENVKEISVDLPVSMANRLLNEKRNYIIEMELELDISIFLKADPHITLFNDNLFQLTYEEGSPKAQEPRRKTERESAGVNKRRPAKENYGKPALAEDDKDTTSPDTDNKQTFDKAERNKPGDKPDEERKDRPGEKADEERKDKPGDKPDEERKDRPPFRKKRFPNQRESASYPLMEHLVYVPDESDIDDEINSLRGKFHSSLRGKADEDYQQITDRKFLFETDRKQIREFEKQAKEKELSEESRSSEQNEKTEAKTAEGGDTLDANTEKNISRSDSEKSEKTSLKRASTAKQKSKTEESASVAEESSSTKESGEKPVKQSSSTKTAKKSPAKTKRAESQPKQETPDSGKDAQGEKERKSTATRKKTTPSKTKSKKVAEEKSE